VAIQRHNSNEVEEPAYANQRNEGDTPQDHNEDVEIDNGPTVVEAHVELAKTIRE